MSTAGDRASRSLVSHAGVPLSRATTFRFTLNPNQAQHRHLLGYAGTARMVFNHQLARVKANLDQRAAERSYGIGDADLTVSLSWSKVSLINHVNEWKDGRATDAPANPDGSRGLSWRGEVSADVFECASVQAATALANWSASRAGARAGKAVGFPRFKSRHKTTPSFRLRAARPAADLHFRRWRRWGWRPIGHHGMKVSYRARPTRNGRRACLPPGGSAPILA
jgi:putative transposase